MESLTPRELEVLRCVVTGALNKQIAAHLGIAEKSAGNAEPLAHAQREAATTALGNLGETDSFEDLINPGCADAVAGSHGP